MRLAFTPTNIKALIAKAEMQAMSNAAQLQRASKKMLMTFLAAGILCAIAAFLLLSPSASASNWNPTVLVNTEAFSTIDDSDDTADVEIRFGDSLGEKIYFDRSKASFRLTDDLYIENGLQIVGMMSGSTLSIMQNAGIATTASGARFHIKGGGAGQKFRYETSESPYSLRIGGKFTGAVDEVALTGGAGVESHMADTTSPAWGLNFSGFDDYAALVRGSNNGQGNAVTWTQHLRLDAEGDVSIGLGSSNAETKLEVGGTASGSHLHAQQILTSSGALGVEGNSFFGGNLTFGDAVADSIMTNASVWTFADDTNFLLSGGVNGLSFDTSTFSVDAQNNRIGIGTTAPGTTLEVAGSMSGTSLTVGSLKNCDTIDTNANGVLSCGTDNAGSGGAPDTATFTDTNPAAWNGDNNTVQLFNDGTKPNIVTDSTSSTVLVIINIEGNSSNTSADSNLAARIIATTDGSDPDCSSSAQVGEDMVSNFTTTTAQYWSNIKGTFLHSPGVAGTIKYSVCSSAAGASTMTDTATSINVTLVEFGG